MRSVALVLSFILAACASTQDQSAREIRAQYDALEAAFERQDPAAVIAMRSPDFEAIGLEGQRDDASRMAEYTRQWFVMNKPPIETRMTILTVNRRSKDEVTVTVLQEASRYQDLAGKLRRNQHSVVQDETWVRTPAGWLLRRVENIRDRKRWIDGKRVDPSRPYDPEAPPFEPDNKPSR